jgi:prophage antirepressor-like protein
MTNEHNVHKPCDQSLDLVYDSNRQIMTVQGSTIPIILIGDDTQEPWFRCNDLAKALGYKDYSKAVRDHLPKKRVKTLSELLACGGVRTAGPSVYNENDLSSKFTRESGVYRLVGRSKLPIAEAFQDWVEEEVLPSIRKTGMYKVQARPFMCLDDTDASNINWISEFANKHVVYILQFEPDLYKIGHTKDIRRRCSTHKRDYGAFRIIKVWQTFNSYNIEQLMLRDFGLQGVRRAKLLNGLLRDELFTLNDTINITTVMEWVYNYVATEMHPVLEQQRIIERDQRHAERMQELAVEKLRLELELSKTQRCTPRHVESTVVQEQKPVTINNDGPEVSGVVTFTIPTCLNGRVPVFQMDPATGEEIQRFDSVTAAGKAMNTNKSNITTAASKPGTLCCGYHWKYDKPIVCVARNTVPPHPRHEPVKQTSLDGRLIFVYNSIYDAGIVLNKHPGVFKHAIYKNNVYAGYLWSRV